MTAAISSPRDDSDVMTGVALVTDSTAYLPEDVVERWGVTVVPLHVLVDDVQFRENLDISPGELVAAMQRGAAVSTSRPSPAAFVDAYERIAAAGASSIVSVHISAELSGTYDAASLAAPHAPVPVITVDSGSMGLALGEAVVSAACAARSGAPAEVVAEVAQARAAAAVVTFYVDSLDSLRRGGRIGAASALVGSALAIKPLLALQSGRIVAVERLRTATRALARLAEVSAEAIRAEAVCDVAVHHVGSPERAEAVRESLAAVDGAGTVTVVEVGGVAGVHLGPGALAVSVSPRRTWPIP